MKIYLSENLRRLRAERGIKQEELAKHIGISVQSVSKWERGETLPDITLLPKIAEFYSVSADELLGTGKSRREREIGEFKTDWDSLALQRYYAARLALAEKMYADYPNEPEVLRRLMVSLRENGYFERSLEITEELLMLETDPETHYEAVRNGAFCSHWFERYGRQYADMVTWYFGAGNQLYTGLFQGDGKNDVLKGFNLTIRPGEHIALIGLNGAGKSTIVKLLCGFYVPTSGSVKIGGAEASKIPEEERFSKISAVFQDLCILPHTVGENISMREEAKTDLKRAAASLDKAKIGRLKDELSRPMTRAVSDEGIELSGGEGQKLMMARAIYKDAPILILDEPTAALDPIAESETYESFHELSLGKSALYISHRLAGTRFCDRIVFLSGGKACEIGTHDELMKLNGGYAEMFRLQSHYYNGGEAK